MVAYMAPPFWWRVESVTLPISTRAERPWKTRGVAVVYREEHPMQALVKEFRTFLLRGNLVDMAVGIVIGIAFAALVNALVTDLITPIIAAIAGKHDFSSLSFTIHKSHFLYGAFLNAVISFVSIAAAVFFFVVKPVNALMA